MRQRSSPDATSSCMRHSNPSLSAPAESNPARRALSP
jgi:hypothetical protein